MSSFPNPLPTIAAADLLMALYERTGDRDEVRRVGEGLGKRARDNSRRADERRFLKRAGVPGPPFEGTADEPGTEENPLSPEYAQELFDYLRGLDYIPFDYPADGCYARAHEMARVMQEQDIQCAKVWNHNAGSPLVARNEEFGEMRWQFHVAVVVYVAGPNGPTEMVIDPSLAETPVTVDQWVALQNGPDGQATRVTSAEPYKYQPTNPGQAGADYGTIWMDPDNVGTRATLESLSVQRDLIRVGRQLTLPEDAPALDLTSA